MGRLIEVIVTVNFTNHCDCCADNLSNEQGMQYF